MIIQLIFLPRKKVKFKPSKDENLVDIHYYDVFAGDHDVTISYTIGNSDMIFIDHPNVNKSYKNHKIIKLINGNM